MLGEKFFLVLEALIKGRDDLLPTYSDGAPRVTSSSQHVPVVLPGRDIPAGPSVSPFYKEMWDHADKSLIPTIFHPGFTFRGSLGPSLIGYDQFAGYVDWVTTAFGNYTTDILALIEEENRVSGKMRFHGTHRREVFGVPASGRHVWWTGMPIFTFDDGKVRDLYVLGDIHGLIGRMQA